MLNSSWYHFGRQRSDNLYFQVLLKFANPVALAYGTYPGNRKAILEPSLHLEMDVRDGFCEAKSCINWLPKTLSGPLASDFPDKSRVQNRDGKPQIGRRPFA